MDFKKVIESKVEELRAARRPRRRDGYIASPSFYTGIEDATKLEIVNCMVDDLDDQELAMAIQAICRQGLRQIEKKIAMEVKVLELTDDSSS